MHGDEDGMIPEEGNKNKRGDYAVPQEMVMSREETTPCKEKTVRDRKYTSSES